MTEQIEPKKKRGRPPWTEEQKQARRELNAKKREERAIEQRRMETQYQRNKRVKKGKRYREDKIKIITRKAHCVFLALFY